MLDIIFPSVLIFLILFRLIMVQVNSEFLRENLEKIVGMDDSTFSGIDLATLIRNKYGRSYDVQLIKKVQFSTSETRCKIDLSLTYDF